MKNKTFRALLLIIGLSVACTAAYAQGPGFDEDTPDTVPLDGGLSLLVAVGIAYGAKKLKAARTEKDNVSENV